MKKLLLFFVCAAAAVAVNAAPEEVEFDKLPKNSQEFIRKNFPNEKVKSVVMDREASWDKYTVYFNSGNRISFEGGNGDWSQIEMKSGSLPLTVVPAKIKAYIAGKYPDQKTVMMQTTASGYKVGLSNNTAIDFDKDGDFVKAAQ